MAILNGDNYKGQYIDKPSSKMPKGENGGRKRLLMERITLDAAVAIGDRVLGPKIPASSIVTGATIKISKSLGVTGIFDLGFLANGVDAEDTAAFVTGADGGGQAALKGADSSNAGIFQRFSESTQLVFICTEAVTGAVTDGVLECEVEFVND